MVAVTCSMHICTQHEIVVTPARYCTAVRDPVSCQGLERKCVIEVYVSVRPSHIVVTPCSKAK